MIELKKNPEGNDWYECLGVTAERYSEMILQIAPIFPDRIIPIMIGASGIEGMAYFAAEFSNTIEEFAVLHAHILQKVEDVKNDKDMLLGMLGAATQTKEQREKQVEKVMTNHPDHVAHPKKDNDGN